jgi:hypothetical protein
VLEAHEYRRDCSRARNDKRFRDSQPTDHRPTARRCQRVEAAGWQSKQSKRNQTVDASSLYG